MKRNEDSLRNFWENIKQTNIWIREIIKEEKEKVPEKIFENIIVKNFPKVGKEIVTQVEEVESPPQDNPRKNTWLNTKYLTKVKYKFLFRINIKFN